MKAPAHIKIDAGDVISDPSSERYDVLACAGTRVLFRDADGCRWVISRRRVESGSWSHRARKGSTLEPLPKITWHSKQRRQRTVGNHRWSHEDR